MAEMLNIDPVMYNGFVFFTTYITSIISASLGLAKCLKNGVARPIGPGGRLDGLFSGRHLFAFFASVFCLAARGACIGIVNGQVYK